MTASKDNSLTDNIYYNLRKSIAYLQLESGYKLSEVRIAERYDCSRIPVREAVGRLAGEGCLVIYPKRGSYVAPIDLERMEHARYLREVIETRIVLDDYDKGLLQPIVPVLTSMIARQAELFQANDYAQIYELDNEFHHLFYSIDDKDFAYEQSGINEINYSRARLLTLKVEDRNNMLSQHNAIVQAIRDENREALNASLVEHFNNVSKIIECNIFLTASGESYFSGELAESGD